MTDRAPYFRRGQRLSARGLNRLGALAERGARLKVFGPDIRLIDTPMGKVIIASGAERERGVAGDVSTVGLPYRLLETGPDWLRCQSIPEGDVHYVLKPWELRRSSLDHIERNDIWYDYDPECDDRRLAIYRPDLEKSQWEIIIIPYVAQSPDYLGDVIVALPHTPVSIEIPNPDEPGGEPIRRNIDLIDLNLAGREFVREADLELE